MLVNRASGLLVLLAMLTSATALAAPPTKEQCIAANEAVQYLREAHKLREAREKLLLCVSEACPGPVREDCAQRLDEVAKATPSIVFDVKDASRQRRVGDVKVTMDGQPLAGNAGAAVELDPGEHTFVFEAAGLAKVEKKFVVVEGVKGRREVIRLGSAKPPEAATPASAPSSRRGVVPVERAADSGVGRVRRWWRRPGARNHGGSRGRREALDARGRVRQRGGHVRAPVRRGPRRVSHVADGLDDRLRRRRARRCGGARALVHGAEGSERPRRTCGSDPASAGIAGRF